MSFAARILASAPQPIPPIRGCERRPSHVGPRLYSQYFTLAYELSSFPRLYMLAADDRCVVQGRISL